ncbi:hypothetical protein [Kitasatospora sp. NPDC088134]|uniref:hypothetical protein n=1 Tax=Kitasatospora sp. NPDC088134 TaxID=3364071 RepID=UPI00381BC5EE
MEPGPERNAALDATYDGHPWSPGPNAMLPVVQLYARDVPALPRPDGTDLLQVLWCPLDHDPEWMPTARPVWRSSAAVDRPLAAPPEPADLSHYGQYLPEPCLLHPEEVTEYPAPLELDPSLRQRVADHCEHAYPGLTRHSYQEELSVAPGWKLGGWGPWSFRDPEPLGCAACGTAMVPLLTIASGGIRDGNSWDPVEDTGPDRDLGVLIGRGYHLQLHRCPASFEHPHREAMQ